MSWHVKFLEKRLPEIGIFELEKTITAIEPMENEMLRRGIDYFGETV